MGLPLRQDGVDGPADGIVSYKLRLAPGEKRAVELHYYVDAPASMLGE